MKWDTLICFTLFLWSGPSLARAEQPTLDEFPVSDDRMVELIDLAVDGKLTIPADPAIPEHFEPGRSPAERQIRFLGSVIAARERSFAWSDGRSCYRAVLAFRAGNQVAADDFLGDYFSSSNDGHEYCILLYTRWNHESLSYRFLQWWSLHVVGPDSILGTVSLMGVAQILAMPFLFTLRRAIKNARLARSMLWPVLAVAFAEFVPCYWAVVGGSAWAVAFNMDKSFDNFNFVGAFMVVIIGVIFAMSYGVRMGVAAWIGFAAVLCFLGALLTAGPPAILWELGLISKVGRMVGTAFWSAVLAVAGYFILLCRRAERPSSPVT